MKLVDFMQGNTGRFIRSGLGLVLIAAGIGLGGPWWALAVVGLVPLAAGMFNFCLAAPLFGAPVRHAHHRA